MYKYKIIIKNNLDKNLYNEWLDLWKKSSCASYVNGPQWLRSIIDSFGYKHYKIFCLYSDTNLLGIVALVEEKVFGVKTMTVPPQDFVTGIPFLAESVERQDVFQLLVNEISKNNTVILGNIPEEFLINFSKMKSKFVSTSHQTLNFYLKIKENENGKIIIPNEEKLLRETKKVRQSFRMKTFNGQNKKIMRLAFKIDIKSRKYDKAYNAFSDKLIKKLYENLGKNFGEYMAINIVYFNNKAIAYEMGFLINKIYHGSQIAYDKSYSKQTPGKVTEVMLINSVASRGGKVVDYGSGENYIKRLICPEYRNLYKIVVSSNALIFYYLKSLSTAKERIFNLINQNIILYTAYKKLLRFVTKK